MLTFRPDLQMRPAVLLDVDPGHPRTLMSEGQD
jgi:hypothetical protein